MQSVKNNKKLSYLQCPKEGYHFGQVLNIVCIEPSCFNKLLCCNACVEQEHKKHITKPLKMVIQEARDNISNIKPAEINQDIIFDIVEASKKTSIKVFEEEKSRLMKNIDEVEKSILYYYKNLSQKISLKTIKSQAQLDKIFDQVYQKTDSKGLFENLQKIINFFPRESDQETYKQVKQNQLIQSLNQANAYFEDLVTRSFEEEITKMAETLQRMNSHIVDFDLFAGMKKHVFNPEFKHNDVSIIEPNRVKSNGSSGYKFCTMYPKIEQMSGTRKISYKIRESTSNWIAIGMCHRNVIVKNSYLFNFGNVGHGSYMISTNGGTWSNIKAEYNNVVKAFTFKKGDIVDIDVNFDTKNMTFKLRGSSQTYNLAFETKQGDELYPCVLFYYANDEVQYIHS